MLELRDYQIIGVNFLKSRQRALLLDQAGLGKTIQAIKAATPPTLITAPTYLLDQWKEVIEQNCPNDTVAIASGSRYQRVKVIESEPDWLIVNHDMLRTYRLGRKFETLILDESHHFRKHEAARSKKALELARRISRVYLLTASPIKKEVDDLYMQLKIVDPDNFRSYDRFVWEYTNFVYTPYGQKVSGIRNPDGLRKLLNKYAIRRSYKEAGRSLPDKISSVITVKPSDEWRKRYNDVHYGYQLKFENEKVNLTNVMEMLTTLRQLTVCNEKLQAVADLIDDAMDDTGAVVFTWFRDSAHVVGKAINAPVITGETPGWKRVSIAKNNSVVVANIAAMSEGIDLSAKRMVIYFEEDYLPGSMEQSLWRVQRERKDASIAPVRVYYIHMENSVDKTVHETQRDRNASITSLLRDELMRKR